MKMIIMGAVGFGAENSAENAARTLVKFSQEKGAVVKNGPLR